MTYGDDYYLWGMPQEEHDRFDCFTRINVLGNLKIDAEEALYRLQNGEVEGLKFHYTNTHVIVRVSGTDWETEYPFANSGFSYNAVISSLEVDGFEKEAKNLKKFLRGE
ncbi:hypothetical protein [Paenibacillus larvae]|uniref:Uncharacterized protein n=1 Tax=Paenibacillus larvae subsp. larvae TaxID=147375 RepID=A0A6C0QX75_9BACL|nr:hypothetical protein [Paenibacillus larvae]QHZ53384.1 hypothetical protein ERICV_04333 [Paenibacillus larvae subsp. larvae]